MGTFIIRVETWTKRPELLNNHDIIQAQRLENGRRCCWKHDMIQHF